MNKPELLAPAGSFEKMQAAVQFGADAVYFAGSGFGLRARAGNFEADEMAEAFAFLRANGKKGYVTVNAYLKNGEFEGLKEYFGLLSEIKPDSVIVSDPGVFHYAKKYAPKIPIHISTQANVTNLAAVEFWHEMGAERVILARELSGEEIRHICKNTSCEIEVFVHGAMCISMSGRCLISNYMTGRDANAGDCAQPCRWNYALVEQSREGQYYPVEQDERGTYFYNSKDLCLIDRIGELTDAGVKSLKIEGRMKSVMYVSVVTGVYRQAIEKAIQGNYITDKRWMEMLQSVSHREYTEAFYDSEADHKSMNYGTSSYIRGCEYLGQVLGDAEDGTLIEAKGKFAADEAVSVLTPDMEETHILTGAITEPNGKPLEFTKPGIKCILKGLKLPAGSIIRRYEK
ncbi:peptidase U32 family protein [Seleniivibrio woodruffii]|uniref:Putative protease n=1 Tax=Seleniivibrio woodruffii TaxID=1078050 RepID=A0A4R1K7J3_9BACT|nr:U32 family peptidase [Seleniivibrio woodruffii]TCK60010.1 putative protease [Seleniivibrio woodruffii]TVZ35769.1 putative protease [Seleniivibrio woodruffii]